MSFFSSKDQQKGGVSLENMAEGKKKKEDSLLVYFLWWRRTYYGGDQPYKILHSHNIPQRSHKVIIVSVLIILIL